MGELAGNLGDDTANEASFSGWNEFSAEAAAARESVGRDGVVYVSEGARIFAESLQDLPRTPAWGKHAADPYWQHLQDWNGGIR